MFSLRVGGATSLELCEVCIHEHSTWAFTPPFQLPKLNFLASTLSLPPTHLAMIPGIRYGSNAV